MTWLNTIQAALTGVTTAEVNSTPPEYPVCKHDHVVGIANHELRKLYFLFRQNLKESKVAMEAAKAGQLSHNRKTLLKEVQRLTGSQDALWEMFWASCLHDFPELLGKQCLTIRQGWKIVWYEQQEERRTFFHHIDDD